MSNDAPIQPATRQTLERPERRRRLRIVATAVASLVAVAGVAGLAGAYVYQPKGLEGFESPYLASLDSRYIETPTARFHYTVSGSGDPVVLVHGGAVWLYSWRETAEALARSHTVYAVDLPGHGYTSLKREDDFVFDLPAMTASIEEFMDAVGLKRAALVGHSWGGGWALRFAQLHPDRTVSLVLVDPSGIVAEGIWDWRILEYPVLGELLVNLMRRGDVQRLMEKSFHNPARLTDDMVMEYWAPGSQPIARRAVLDLQRNLDWSVTETALPRTTTRTLVLWGEDDRFSPVEMAGRFVEAMPNAKKHTLSDCGHTAHEDCPDQVIPAIATFLAQAR